MAYYKQAGYMTEAEMKKQGKNETEKAKQRGLNFTIRLEHYAKSNSLQFRKSGRRSANLTVKTHPLMNQR